jgi:RNA binding exosome subunit
MLAHTIIIEVFVKEGEDLEKIKKRFLEFIPFDLKEENISLNQRTGVGFSQQRIKTLEIILTKQRHIKKFLKNLIEMLSEETAKRIISEAKERLDQELYFYLRFDKKNFLENGDLTLTNEGDCFYLKMKIAAFPQKEEIALEIVQNIFEQSEQ